MITLNARDQSGEPSGTGTASPAAEDHRVVAEAISDLFDHPPGLFLTSSCTHALEAAALLSGVGPGDEVIVPAFTFPSTANAFLLRRATVRFADIQDHDGNIDPKSVEARVSPRTKAIVVVHYGGVSAATDDLDRIARNAGAQLVEDAAHAVFASHKGQALGRVGTFACVSFHRTKNISAGDGGALIVNDPDYIERARIVLDKGTNRGDFEAGRVSSYDWTDLGSSWRLPDSSLEILKQSFANATTNQKVRQHAWKRYRSELASWAQTHGVTLPSVPTSSQHPAHLFWIGLPNPQRRTEFVEHCRLNGVEVARHFGSLPDSPFGKTIATAGDGCPIATRFSERLVRLPLHHQLDDAQISQVLEVISTAPL